MESACTILLKYKQLGGWGRCAVVQVAYYYNQHSRVVPYVVVVTHLLTAVLFVVSAVSTTISAPTSHVVSRRRRDHTTPHNTTTHHHHTPPPSTQRGILPCLRQGRVTFLLLSSSMSSHSLRRVVAGSITSSTNPRCAATIGLANLNTTTTHSTQLGRKTRRQTISYDQSCDVIQIVLLLLLNYNNK